MCVMKRGTYHQKLNKIINLPQFQKLRNSQKNTKHPVLKKEERVKNILISLLKEGKIDEELYYSISQPARLHGLPKVHKKKKIVRLVLSIPGSALPQGSRPVFSVRSVSYGWNRNWKKLTIRHKNLGFTLETEVVRNLSFLDMRLIHGHILYCQGVPH